MMVDTLIVDILSWFHLISYIITVFILIVSLYTTYSTKNSLDKFTTKLINLQKMLAYYVLMILITGTLGFLYSLGINNWDFLGPVTLINDPGFLMKLFSIVVLLTLVGTLHRIIRVKIGEMISKREISNQQKIETLQSIFRLEFYSILIIFFILFSTKLL